MRGSSVRARREVRFTIVAYCNDLFLRCSVETVYWWGNCLDWRCPEAQEITRIAREKLGFKKSYNSRDLFWQLQCTWRKMIERNLIEKYKPEIIMSEKVTQKDLDNLDNERQQVFVLKSEVLKLIKLNFESAYETMDTRSESDKTIIGNLLTIVEMELKKDIKELQEFKP